MTSIQIGETASGKQYEYIGLDFAEKRVYLLVGRGVANATPFLLKPDSELFHKLADVWQTYCCIAWRKMKEK